MGEKYSAEQYLQMAICWIESEQRLHQQKGEIERTKEAEKLFFERHGWTPESGSFVTAVKMFGQRLQLLNPSVNGSQEATSSNLQEPNASKEKEFSVNDMNIVEVNYLEDETTLTVKVEDADTEDLTTDMEGDGKIKEENYSKTYCSSAPIVYTTRLEDMQTLKHINKKSRLTIQHIISHIISESKPKLNKHSSKLVQPLNKTNTLYLSKYKYVQRKLEHINNIARLTVVDNNEKSVTNNASQCQQLLSYKFIKKNMSLINLCKQLSIVIERLPFQHELDTNDHCDIESSVTVSKKRKVERKIEILSGDDKRKPSKIKNLRKYCVVVKDHASNETEMYYINLGQLTKYYIESKILDNSEIPQVYEIPIWEINVCCWYDRQDQIATLTEHGLCRFGRKSHNCQPGNCNCCCSSEHYDKSSHEKPQKSSIGSVIDLDPTPMHGNLTFSLDDPTPMDVDDMEIKMLENETSQLFYQMQKKEQCMKYGYSENWLQDLDRIKKSLISCGSLMSKAMQYTRVPKQPKVTTAKNVVLTPAGQMKLIDRTEIELIKVGDNNTLTFRKYSKDNNILEDNDDLNDEASKTSHNVCCWSARHKIVRNWLKLEPNMQCLMRPPHLCEFGNCICCCKARQKKHKHLYDIFLSNSIKSFDKFDKKYALNALKYSRVMNEQSKTEQDPKNRSNNIPGVTKNIIQPIAGSSSSNLAVQNSITPMRSGITLVPTLQVPSIQPTSHHPRTSKIQELYNNTTQHIISPTVSINSETSLPISSTTLPPTTPINIAPTPTVPINSETGLPVNSTALAPTTPINIAPTPMNTTPQDLAVDSMINTILDRFKDVRLAINEQGKVTAELGTPVHALSSAEIKVLVNILSHAQKQVDELGLVPGTVLNNVNSQYTQTTIPGPDIIGSANDEITKSGRTDVTIVHEKMDIPEPNIIESANDEMTTSGNVTTIHREKMGIAANKDISRLFMNVFTNHYKLFNALFKGSQAVNTQAMDNVDSTSFPVITDVFSLKHKKVGDKYDVPSTSKETWHKPPEEHGSNQKSLTNETQPTDGPLCPNVSSSIPPPLFWKHDNFYHVNKEPEKIPYIHTKYVDPPIETLRRKPQELKTYNRKKTVRTYSAKKPPPRPDADKVFFTAIYPQVGEVWSNAESPSGSTFSERHENPTTIDQGTPMPTTQSNQVKTSDYIQLAFEPDPVTGVDTVLVEIEDDDDEPDEAILGT